MIADVVIQARVLVALLLACCAPGALLLAVSGIAPRIPRLMLPAAALAGSLLLASAISLVQAWRETPTRDAVAAFALVVVALCGATIVQQARMTSRRGGAIIARLFIWPVSWMRGASRLALLSAGLALVLALLAGEHLGPASPSWYHVGLVQQLMGPEHPSPAAMTPFPGGSADPGHLLPVWHQLLAIVATLAHASAPAVVQLAPVLVAPIIVLAWAGLAGFLLDAPAAGGVAAAALVCGRMLATTPRMDGIANAANPTVVAAGTLLPLCWAMMVERAGNAGEKPTTKQAARKRARLPRPVLALLATATPAVAVMLARGSAAWLVVGSCACIAAAVLELGRRRAWQLRLPLLRTAAAPGIIAAATAWLLHAASDGRGGESGGTATRTAVDIVVHGRGWGQHLRADYAIWTGGLALLGMAMLATAARRGPGLRLTFAPLVASMLLAAVLTPGGLHLVTAGSDEAQAASVLMALPWMVGIAAAITPLGRLVDAASGSSGRHRAGRLAIIGAAAAAPVSLALLAPALEPMARTPSFPPAMAWGSAALLIALLAAAAHRHRGRTPIALVPDSPAAHEPSTTGHAVAVAAMLVACIPAIAEHRNGLREVVSDGPVAGIARVEDELIDPETLSRLRNARPGESVLADQALGAVVRAHARLRVFALTPGSFATTPANLGAARTGEVRELLAPRTSEIDRLRIIDELQPDWLLLRADASQAAALEFARRHPDVFRQVERGSRTVLFQVHHDEFLER